MIIEWRDNDCLLTLGFTIIYDIDFNRNKIDSTLRNTITCNSSFKVINVLKYNMYQYKCQVKHVNFLITSSANFSTKLVCLLISGSINLELLSRASRP